MSATEHLGQNQAPTIAALPEIFAQAGIAATKTTAIAGPSLTLAVDATTWATVARLAAAHNLRWSALWGEHLPPQITVTAALAAKDGHLLITTTVPDQGGQLPSQTPIFPAANRPERYLQEMFGLHFTDHPDPRRWIRHQAWTADQYPLRQEFPLAGTPPTKTPPDCDYPFVAVEGEGVYEIPVGPVHAGIIEPGHFRFQAMGEDILILEEHLGYVHRGIEKCAEGRDIPGLIRLAARLSGDSTVAHSWAACRACELALAVTPPPRAQTLRAILTERERIANHLGDIGACCNDVGFAFAHVQFGRLRELWQRDNARVFGHRLLMDVVVAGGVKADINTNQITQLKQATKQLRQELTELLPLLYEYPSLQDRLRTTGVLSLTMARKIGALGYVARASGEGWDLRRDAAYPPYDQVAVTVPTATNGDCSCRLRIRGEEILVSLDLLANLLNNLPPGEVITNLPTSATACQGFAGIEGWRGEVTAYVHLAVGGRVRRYFPRDPSWLNWPALEALIGGVIVPDFPLCNKSINGSYAGHDL